MSTLIRNIRYLLLCIVGLTWSHSLTAQTVLNAKLVPAIIIDGPHNSLQEVQYSTDVESNTWKSLAYVRLDVTPKAFHDDEAQGENRFYRTQMIGTADTNLVWIPPGTFMMGSSTNEQGRFNNEGPQTQVTFTKGFLISRYEVRVADWLATMGPLPPGIQHTEPQEAVEALVWTNATNFCHTKTLADIQSGKIPPGWRYRLPTEAEWEYACRAGTETPFAVGFGTELRNDAVRADAEFNGSFPYPTNLAPVNPPITHDYYVGRFAPNGFGLYDMHGNVEEWSWDYLGGNLPGGSVTNLVGTFGPQRGRRGGNTGSPGAECRSASRRLGSILSGTVAGLGIRIVLIPPD